LFFLIFLFHCSFIELVFDNSIQPDNWHEIYTFIRDIRNQLQCINPFANDDDQNTSNTNTNTSNKEERRDSNDDEGIMISLHDNNQFSSTVSTTSSDEFEQSSTSSVAASYDTIKDELKHHYYGLFRSLDSLTSMADRVREKYREETKC
jgi:lipopolysaccharide export LptBFGC system permease protein LptF